MQNLQMPKVHEQVLFYLQQLTVNAFCLYNTETKGSRVFLYHEGQAKKGPNKIDSFLIDWHLRLFADNCPGQNKNQEIVRLFMALTDTGRFSKAKLLFLIWGHFPTVRQEIQCD
jgi:hypothetical protein